MNWFFVVITATHLTYFGPYEMGECMGHIQAAQEGDRKHWTGEPVKKDYACFTNKELLAFLGRGTLDKIADADIEVGN